MAPPSLLEFVQMLLIREAVATLCPSLSGSVHLGNKGCLLDFTESLSEVRQKALRGYVCDFCRWHMANDGHSKLADEVTRLLDREWLGSPTDPRSVAGVAANLKYNLFVTKGAKATPKETFVTALRQEGAKQVLVIIGAVVIALILVLLGLKSSGGQESSEPNSLGTLLWCFACNRAGDPWSTPAPASRAVIAPLWYGRADPDPAVGSVEFAVAEGRGEGGPGARGDDQDAAGGVLGVADCDGRAGDGHLDAVGRVAAAAALPPAGGAQV